MWKKILIAAGVIVLIIVILLVLVFKNLDAIAKGVIERVGTSVTGTKVTVGDVDIKLKEGKATIKKLRVNNPPGFSHKPMIDFGEISAQIDYKTLAIKEVYIGSPHFRYEQKGDQSNFQVVQKNIQSGSDKKSKKEKHAEKEEEDAVYEIDLFQIKDAEVVFISDSEKEPQTLEIKNITFRDLKGTSSQILTQVMGQLTGQIIAEVAKKFVTKEVQKEVGKAIDKSLGSELKGIFGAKKEK